MLIVAQVFRHHDPNIYQQTYVMIETLKTKREARRAVLLLLLACLSAHALAFAARAQQPPPEAPNARDNIQVIPAPKHVASSGQQFRLTPGTRVDVADAKSEDDRFAAQEFADDLRETAGVALRLGRGG